jgi:hypothetical protein
MKTEKRKKRLHRLKRFMAGTILCIVCIGLLHGCMIPQKFFTAQHQLISLGPSDLSEYGIAFITPSTVTGQEEEKQAVALTFAEVMRKKRPELRCVTLPETLSAVNKAGLANDYKQMFEDYRDTGIFNRDILKKVGEVTGVKYVAQLKLAGFKQGSKGRFSFLGLRVFETKSADIRLFFQIWDTTDGSIAWEAVQELNYAVDSVTEQNVALRTVLQETAENLIERLPKKDDGERDLVSEKTEDNN